MLRSQPDAGSVIEPEPAPWPLFSWVLSAPHSASSADPIHPNLPGVGRQGCDPAIAVVSILGGQGDYRPCQRRRASLGVASRNRSCVGLDMLAPKGAERLSRTGLVRSRRAPTILGNSCLLSFRQISASLINRETASCFSFCLRFSQPGDPKVYIRIFCTSCGLRRFLNVSGC